MNDTREIYWNVGHWVIIPMYALVALVFGLVAYGFLRRYRIWRSGKPLDRRDHLGSRIAYFVRTTLDQKRVLRVMGGGLPHALFFWGFVALFVGTLLVMLQADLLHPVFGITILKGRFYKAFSLVTDVAGLVAIAALAALLIRRFVIRPKGLVTIADDYLMHGLLFAILITGFLIEAARMAVTEVPTGASLASWSPGGLLLAQAFGGLGAESLATMHRAIWWIHLGLVFAFISVIPFTKLRHMFTTPVNYLIRSHDAKGTMLTLDLEDETAEQFGAAHVGDLRWKDIYDADACTACKRCQDRCPAWSTEKPLSPMTLVQEIGAVAFRDSAEELVQAISADAIWACTTCRACQEICPAEIEHVDKIIELRRNLVLMEGAFPGAEVESAARSTEMSGNPLGLTGSARADWAEDLSLPIVPCDDPIEVLYFVGCYASFDPRNQKVARAFVEICHAAGVRVGILGKREKCCGEPMRKLGNEYLYRMMAADNIAAIAGSGATRVVATCPHCFNTLKRDYRELGLEVTVEHHTTFIGGLIESGRLAVSPAPLQCTYHDSCYLGRYMDLYAEPRAVLAAIGASVTEMVKHREESFCCGGGGGRVLADERLGTRISAARVLQARETQAPWLVSNCPFCLTMFEDAIGAADCGETLRARDLAEVVLERLAARPG
jgi:Fe-S oxidoreductase/nitrate reductase gamma subunit